MAGVLLAGVLAPGVPVASAAAAQAHAGQLAAVRARSVAVVEGLVAALAPGSLDATYAAAEPAAAAALRAAWADAATTATSTALAAAGAWDAAPAAAGLSTVPPVPAGLLPDPAAVAAQLRLTVLIEAKQRIAAGVPAETALEHARQRAGRAAAGIGARTARTAHERTLQGNGLGWARIPATNGCPWCLLLASRGPVYTSQRTAQGRVGPYHPWCRCRTLAVPRGLPLHGYLDPDSDVGDLVQQAAAAWDATGTMDRYSASTFARTQERARRGRQGPGRPRQAQASPAAPAAPRLSDADQARLNTANREANRLNAQAYRLQQQGRDAEAATLREQAAVHRAEAARITDTLRSAGGGGGRPPRPPYGVGADGEPLWQSGSAVPTPGDLRARELVGVGWEHFNTPKKIRSGVAAKEVAIAKWIEARYGRVISVDEDPREFARTPDALWGPGTVEFKTLHRPTLNAMKQNLRDAGTKSRNAVLDLRVVALSRADALALATGLDRRHLDRLDLVLLIGENWHHWLKGGAA